MERTSLIIFDLDGTLVDSRDAILSSIRHALNDVGLASLDFDETRAVQQDLASTLREACQNSANVISENQIQSFIRSYRAHHSKEPHRTMRVYDGVIDSLAELSKKCDLAVATTKHSPQARHIVETLNLSHFFSVIQGTDPGMRYKPEPDILHAVLQLRGANAYEAAYVGDSPHDMMAAHAAGMRAVGAVYGFAGQRALAESSPHHWVSDPRELKSLL
jgi:phosphoglycolate phosphatase